MDYFGAGKIVEPERGDLLISEPYLPDPNFERTVILMCEHDDNGSFGFVLNKKANVKLPDVIDDVGDYYAELFIGGPVQQDTLHFVHRNENLSEKSSELIDKVFWGGNFDELLALINTKAIYQQDIRFFMGYSGWSSGQLMEEMKAGSWIVMKNVNAEMIFDWDNQELWKECLKSMGGKFRLMSNYPKDPRLN